MIDGLLWPRPCIGRRRSLCCTLPHHVADTAEPGLADLDARPRGRGILARAILETAGKFMMSPTHSFFFL
jgi:hypothetical protein